MRLTEANIKKAPVGTILREDASRYPGLHLRVGKKAKAFYLYFRTRDGQERRPRLGVYGPAYTLAHAREDAAAMLRRVYAGEDPVAIRKAAVSAPTVKDLAKLYQEEHMPHKKSRDEDERLLVKVVEPELGALQVHSVEFRHIHGLHKQLASTPVQANRVVALLSKMFNLAELWNYRPNGSNPCRHVKRYKERKRKRYVRPDEAVKVADLLRAFEHSRPEAVLFLYLLIYTGARPAEVRSFRPDQLIGTEKIVLDDHKTAEVTGEPRTIYLPPQVQHLLGKVLKLKHETIVGIKSPKALWDFIRREAGCPDLRMYDLRHSFASAALAAGYTLNQIGELLGHTNVQTTARYAHLVEDMARAAAIDTAQAIERGMSTSALSTEPSPSEDPSE